MTGSRKAGATYLRAIAEHGLKFPVARGRLDTCNSSLFHQNPMIATDCGSNYREQIRLASGNLGGLKRLNTRTMSIASSQSDSWS